MDQIVDEFGAENDDEIEQLSRDEISFLSILATFKVQRLFNSYFSSKEKDGDSFNPDTWAADYMN